MPGPRPQCTCVQISILRTDLRRLSSTLLHAQHPQCTDSSVLACTNACSKTAAAAASKSRPSRLEARRRSVPPCTAAGTPNVPLQVPTSHRRTPQGPERLNLERDTGRPPRISSWRSPARAAQSDMPGPLPQSSHSPLTSLILIRSRVTLTHRDWQYT